MSFVRAHRALAASVPLRGCPRNGAGAVTFSSLAALSPASPAARLLHLRGGYALVTVYRAPLRTLSTNTGQRAAAEAEAGAGNASEQAKAEEKPGEQAGAEEQPDFGADEPFVAKASRMIWGTIKVSFMMGIFAGVMYAGWTTVTMLLPVGDSSNAIMRKATDILKSDPDVHNYFGDMKTYGIDLGGRAEGRRYFVPEYKYDDELTGEPYHRVKFTMEGDRGGKKATVYAEVASSTGEFRYLIVVSKDGGKVISVVDRRPPLMTREERQSRVSSLAQDAGWQYYVDNEVDARQQAAVLGDYWLKVRCVRCDDPAQESRCAEAGVEGKMPSWAVTKWKGGRVELVPGVKELAELERMAQPVAREKERVASGRKKGFFASLFE